MIEETIAAVVTAPGMGSVGIIRLSGPESVAIAEKVYGGRGRLAQAESHTIHYGKVVEPQTQKVVDEALFMLMRAPHSFTGEDVVEIQCHGGTVVMRRILQLLLDNGARLAEAGEYSKRAFLNGKRDLAQAEAIMDIVSAKTERGLEAALTQLSGGLSGEIKKARAVLLELIAFIQADIDYPDDDIERLTTEEQIERVEALSQKLEAILATAGRGKMLKDGIRTVIAGKPNVGKSSLLNALLGEKRAIVTDIPGTTRDVIEEYVDLEGVPLRIMDTAGIRETDNVVEQLGVDMARQFLQSADLVLYVFEPEQGLTAEDAAILAEAGEVPVIFLQNKVDWRDTAIDTDLLAGRPLVKLSALYGQGLGDLEKVILQLFFAGDIHADNEVLVTNVRHQHILKESLSHLQNFRRGAESGLTGDFLVIDLQSAWEKLGRITGETVEEDLLDQIFSQFCLGK